MTTSKKIGVVVVIFITGLGFGRFSLPAKVVEKEKIVYQDKIVEKKVETTDSKKKDHKIYTRVETISKDGSKTIETKITDDKSSDTLDNTTDNKTEAVSKTDDKEKTTTYSTQSTIISAIAEETFNSGLNQPEFGLLVQKRILGPIYGGAFGLTDSTFTNKSVGISLGIAF